MKDSQTPAPQPQRIQVEIQEKEADGIYSNFVMLNSNPAEFIIDFARILPGSPKAKVYARIVMAPIHAKALLEALEKNVRMYEEKNGKIRSPGDYDAKEIGF